MPKVHKSNLDDVTACPSKAMMCVTYDQSLRKRDAWFRNEGRLWSGPGWHQLWVLGSLGPDAAPRPLHHKAPDVSRPPSTLPCWGDNLSAATKDIPARRLGIATLPTNGAEGWAGLAPARWLADVRRVCGVDASIHGQGLGQITRVVRVETLGGRQSVREQLEGDGAGDGILQIATDG